jgi:hypothetical protein
MGVIGRCTISAESSRGARRTGVRASAHTSATSNCKPLSTEHDLDEPRDARAVRPNSARGLSACRLCVSVLLACQYRYIILTKDAMQRPSATPQSRTSSQSPSSLRTTFSSVRDVSHPCGPDADYALYADVVNGQKNKMLVGVENKSDRNITLVSIGGSIHHPESSALIQNVRL